MIFFFCQFIKFSILKLDSEMFEFIWQNSNVSKNIISRLNPQWIWRLKPPLCNDPSKPTVRFSSTNSSNSEYQTNTTKILKFQPRKDLEKKIIRQSFARVVAKGRLQSSNPLWIKSWNNIFTDVRILSKKFKHFAVQFQYQKFNKLTKKKSCSKSWRKFARTLDAFWK